MSVQRRRGQPCKVWPQRLVEDRRGNRTYRVDLTEKPYEIKAHFWPQRGSKAEVPGQQDIVVYTMILTSELPDVGLWSRVYWSGRYWDVAAPPVLRTGTRHTRHWSMDIRERPEVADG